MVSEHLRKQEADWKPNQLDETIPPDERSEDGALDKHEFIQPRLLPLDAL